MKYDFLDRLHGLEISSISSEKWHDFLSKLSSKQIDPNFWKSSKPAITLELLSNVLGGKYQNGICFDFGEDVDPSHDLNTFSVFENVVLSAQFATEFHGLKR